MILHSDWRQSPLADAIDRGFDPTERAEPTLDVRLHPEWAAGLTAAGHRLAGDDSLCGTRCDICHERMCAITGPAPASTCPAHRECVECHGDNGCRECARLRRDEQDPHLWPDALRQSMGDQLRGAP